MNNESEHAVFDFVAHLARQAHWSEKTFGPGSRAAGVVDHIRKELIEIEADPGDLKEWIDVVILALNGALRSGAKPQEIIDAIVAKQTKNEGRTWPEWRTADPNKAIEHDRSKDSDAAKLIAEKVEAIGEVFGPKAVSTMVALKEPLPPGTKLYLHPAPFADRVAGVRGVVSDDMTPLDIIRHRATWIRDITSDPAMTLSAQENDRIHRFGADICAALEAHEAGQTAKSAQGEASPIDDLVDRFASALREKLHAAEAKYGYDDAWQKDGWRTQLIHQMHQHIAKGDPRDVAAYCAFAWHHGWSLSHPLTLTDLRVIYGHDSNQPSATPMPITPTSHRVAAQGGDELADALYKAGYEDRRLERDYDPRAREEWQLVSDALCVTPADHSALAPKSDVVVWDAEQEKQACQVDVYMFGVGFLVDGKRIPPPRVHVFTRDSASAAARFGDVENL